jgi:mannose-6-phosphate isomerase-like protein (cupin superfamily)
MRALALAGVLFATSAAAQETTEDAQMGRRVQEVLRAHQESVFRCVAEQPVAPDGEALLRVVIARDGHASHTEILKADAGARAASECVARVARAWDYTSLRASEGDQLVLPLRFQPDAPGAGNVALGARLTRHVIAKKGTLKLRTLHTAAIFVSSGTVRFDVAGSPSKYDAGSLVLLGPRTSLSLSAPGGARVVLVEATTDGAGVAAGAIQPPPLEARTTRTIFDGAGEVTLYLDGVAVPFAIDHLCVKRGASVAKHEHTSDELLYIESGKGTTTLGTESLVIKADESVTIPRGTPHALRVDQDLCALQVYTPQGPEQRFKQGAANDGGKHP